MINGAHSIIYSKDPEADRVFLNDVLSLPSVDVGGGWLIFGLPPAEVAVHPSDENDKHELYFMCDDVQAFIDAMVEKEIVCSPIASMGWGMLTSVTLPGGGKVGVYQPRHPRPPVVGEAKKERTVASRKPAKKSVAKVKAKANPAPKSKAKAKPAPKAKSKAKSKVKAKPAAKKKPRRK